MPNRLFPDLPAKTPLTKDQICLLSTGLFERSQAAESHSVYVYFGQFIIHDFVPSTLEKNMRTVRPELALGSVYQDASSSSGLFGWTTMTTTDGELTCDFIRDADGKPAIPEERNDENRIVAQIHLLFQRLHNDVFEKIAHDPRVVDPFDAARAVCQLFYHHLIEDYARQFVRDRFRNYYFNDAGPTLMNDWLRRVVPAEFALAILRFGHSQIRNSYTRHRHGAPVSVQEFFRKFSTMGSDEAFALPVFALSTDNKAQRIDRRIAPDLNAVSHMSRTPGIVEIDLLASERVGTGTAIRQFVQANYPELRELLRDANDPSLDHVNKDWKLDYNNLPLWLYVLLEAEDQGPAYKGVRLGPLGSVLFCEVIAWGMQRAQATGMRYPTARSAPPVVAEQLTLLKQRFPTFLELCQKLKVEKSDAN